jgi:uroporphyrin-III C-methyltransferase/precorrin-2 dehydrogenase/sirohydrochlorin ferrochelatase
MIDSLPLFHRIAGQPVIVLGMGEAAEAKRRLVERAGGDVCADMQDGIDRGARLAFIAHADEAACRAEALRLRCAGLLVNVVDTPDLCDFTVPSLLDRAPVLVAIGTGGASAGLAKALRLRLEGLLPQGLGRLASALYAARGALRARFPDAGDRRRALDAALAAGGPLDPLHEPAPDAIADWLAGSVADAATVIELHIGSEDPDELTLRAARWLGSADLVAHEPGIAPAILDRARADAARQAIAAGGQAPEHPGLVIVLRR